MTRSTLNTVWLLALTAGFIGAELRHVVFHSAEAALGSTADGCSGRDCAVASLSSSGPMSGTDVTANGAFYSQAGTGNFAMVLRAGAMIQLADTRFNHGTPTHYIKSNGDNLTIDANSNGGAIILSSGAISLATNGEYIQFQGSYPGSGTGAIGIKNDGNGAPVAIDDAQGLIVWPHTLLTCAGKTAAYGDNTKAPEGTIQADVAAGVSTAHRTRICVCTSDGAGSPAYAWMNITSGTIGTATTCAD